MAARLWAQRSVFDALAADLNGRFCWFNTSRCSLAMHLNCGSLVNVCVHVAYFIYNETRYSLRSQLSSNYELGVCLSVRE
jgi:hypothetical protein